MACRSREQHAHGAQLPIRDALSTRMPVPDTRLPPQPWSQGLSRWPEGSSAADIGGLGVVCHRGRTYRAQRAALTVSAGDIATRPQIADALVACGVTIPVP